MSLLNLRGEDSVPEPDNEVVLPETPPGLDAIRAWIRKPRPWVRGIQLWIEHIRSEGPATWKRLRERGLRAARWLRRTLRRIAPATRPVAQLGQIIDELGGMIRRVADELHDLLGKQTDAGTQVREVGRIAQRAGALIVSTTRLTGKVLTLLGRFLALLAALENAPEPAPPGPPKPDPVPPEVPKTDPKPDEGPAEEQPERQSRPTPPDGSGRAPSESATPVPAPHTPTEGTPEPVPSTPPDSTPELSPDPRPHTTPEPPPEASPDPTPEREPDPRQEPAPEPNPRPGSPPAPDPNPKPDPASEPDSSPSTPTPPPPEPGPGHPLRGGPRSAPRGRPARPAPAGPRRRHRGALAAGRPASPDPGNLLSAGLDHGQATGAMAGHAPAQPDGASPRPAGPRGTARTQVSGSSEQPPAGVPHLPGPVAALQLGRPRPRLLADPRRRPIDSRAARSWRTRLGAPASGRHRAGARTRG